MIIFIDIFSNTFYDLYSFSIHSTGEKVKLILISFHHKTAHITHIKTVTFKTILQLTLFKFSIIIIHK